jgi:hypothetical protein
MTWSCFVCSELTWPRSLINVGLRLAVRMRDTELTVHLQGDPK